MFAAPRVTLTNGRREKTCSGLELPNPAYLTFKKQNRESRRNTYRGGEGPSCRPTNANDMTYNPLIKHIDCQVTKQVRQTTDYKAIARSLANAHDSGKKMVTGVYVQRYFYVVLCKRPKPNTEKLTTEPQKSYLKNKPLKAKKKPLYWVHKEEVKSVKCMPAKNSFVSRFPVGSPTVMQLSGVASKNVLEKACPPVHWTACVGGKLTRSLGSLLQYDVSNQ